MPTINGKRYCPNPCLNLLEADDLDKCKFCRGYHKEVDEQATKKLNKFNRLGQVKVWRWVK